MKGYLLGVLTGALLMAALGYAGTSTNPDFFGRPQWGQMIAPPRDAYGRPNFPPSPETEYHDETNRPPC